MRHWSWAQRLLLAEITRDSDAAELVAAEIGDCPGCWRLVATYTTRLAANGWFHVGDNDAVIELILGGIGYALDRLDEETA
jgi:hypothetical protein